ncbi:MAG: hypothetical protein Q4G33_05265 [bacterium]|nr:hypothetical protein [bacterium]
MKRKNAIISVLSVITLIILLLANYFISCGFNIRTDVALHDFSVSKDGTEITLNTTIMSSMGYTRGFKDNGGEAKPHYLTFYSTFGGVNSKFGAKSEHTLTLSKDDSEIYFNRANNEYELVLQKDKETGEWVRP